MEDGWGKVRKYSDTKQRTDALFWEFARIVRGVRPKVFIAENVSGLARGVAKGYFKLILAELSKGYRVESRMIDAQWLGVPQRRRRIIFMGVREDLVIEHRWPKPLPYRFSEDQIQRKRLSLEGVLVPMTAGSNEEMLLLTGFREVDCFWRWMSFAGWIAVK